MKISVEVEDLKLLIAQFKERPHNRDKAWQFVRSTELEIAELEDLRRQYEERPYCNYCGLQIVKHDNGEWVHGTAETRHIDPNSTRWCDGHSTGRATRNTYYD